MDRITNGLLVAFKKERSLSDDLSESELFEHFANYCIVSKEFNGSFSLEDIYSGGGGDKALDGIAILVNGSLVNSQEELEDLEQVNKYLDTDFQKRLEEYYNSLPEERRLNYERRPKQYNGMDIYKVKVVDISSQIRCFASMFLDQAHNAGRYYAKLLDDVKARIFLPSHDPIGYYISVYTKFRLDEFFKNKQIENKYQPFRYHILNIFRMQVSGLDMPDIASNRFTTYCKKMEETLWNDDKCRAAFLRATTVIDSAAKGNYDRAVAKTVTFVKAVKDSVRRSQ
jgi:hypothetical protein